MSQIILPTANEYKISREGVLSGTYRIFQSFYSFGVQ